MGDTVFALGTRRLWAYARIGEAQIRIAGNIISDAHPASILPLAYVLSGNGNCIFSDNQCTLLAGGSRSALVSIRAPRIVAANNLVRRQDDTDAMTLDSGSFGQTPTVTVLGNITYGNIRVNGGALPPQFAPLNILAS